MDLTNLLSWLVGFIVALITIYLTVRHFKTTKTISYIERLNTGEMASIRAEIDEWIIGVRPDLAGGFGADIGDLLQAEAVGLIRAPVRTIVLKVANLDGIAGV